MLLPFLFRFLSYTTFSYSIPESNEWTFFHETSSNGVVVQRIFLKNEPKPRVSGRRNHPANEQEKVNVNYRIPDSRWKDEKKDASIGNLGWRPGHWRNLMPTDLFMYMSHLAHSSSVLLTLPIFLSRLQSEISKEMEWNEMLWNITFLTNETPRSNHFNLIHLSTRILHKTVEYFSSCTTYSFYF